MIPKAGGLHSEPIEIPFLRRSPVQRFQPSTLSAIPEAGELQKVRGMLLPVRRRCHCWALRDWVGDALDTVAQPAVTAGPDHDPKLEPHVFLAVQRRKGA